MRFRSGKGASTPFRRGRLAVGVLLLLALLEAAGCATLRGMGEDIQSLGRGIKKVFTQ